MKCDRLPTWESKNLSSHFRGRIFRLFHRRSNIEFSFGKVSGLIIRLMDQKEVPFSDEDEFIIESEPAFNSL